MNGAHPQILESQTLQKKCVITLSACLIVKNKRCIDIKRGNNYNYHVLVYPRENVLIYQYHSDWLGLQSLDIYIPSLSVGIEYQGEQHYRPISFFGGEKAFEEVVKRDARKAKLCDENNVKLICWRYDEIITVNQLNKKLSQVI